MRSRRGGSMLIIYMMLLGPFVAWRSYLWLSRRIAHAAPAGSLNQRASLCGGSPVGADPVLLKSAPADLVRTAEERGQRLVIVGDVHGCLKQLNTLLTKLSFRPSTDHLILTGDIIAKGPASSAVVDLARTLSAYCVRGNHEDRILRLRRSMRTTPSPQWQIPNVSSPGKSPPSPQNVSLAQSLTDAQVCWLEACPVILRLGKVEGMGEVVVVHAGLVPGVSLEEQDPWHVMNMRTIDESDPSRLVPSAARDGTPWEKIWNAAQERLPPDLRTTVIYGHDARRGLNLQPYTKGLDTGCVKGGPLTALVIEPRVGLPAAVSVVQ